ncbi:MAG TPA: hypothetical protein VL633_10045 [Bacteroidota bacterium]|jgi:hypothetical protein|nr:hypothetical protein [Bacteroidota bacterium]
MKNTVHSAYRQKIDALLRQGASRTLYDRRLNPVEMEVITNRLYHHEKHLLTFSQLRPGILDTHFDGANMGGNVSPGRARMSPPNVSQHRMGPYGEARSGTEQEEQKNGSIFTENTTVTFNGMCFQFSGTLEFGRREDALLVVGKLGGYSPSGNSLLTTLVNYLVVGNLEKHALKRNGYGGNINKALNLNRDSCHSIQIIREGDFVKAVLKTISALERRERPFINTDITYTSLSDRISDATRSRNRAAPIIF